jgi:hypothetical protein
MRVDQLANMLISVGLVPEDAVWDAEGYDGWRTYDNICALYDKLFPVSDNKHLTEQEPSE